jgi:hypothetical protein
MDIAWRHTHYYTAITSAQKKKEWNKFVSLHTLPAECLTKIGKYYCSFQQLVKTYL